MKIELKICNMVFFKVLTGKSGRTEKMAANVLKEKLNKKNTAKTKRKEKEKKEELEGFKVFISLLVFVVEKPFF